VPARQTWPEAHTLPQAPQFWGSLVTSKQVTLEADATVQAMYPELHAMPHFPFEHPVDVPL
jgi:hypothetical protein